MKTYALAKGLRRASERVVLSQDFDGPTVTALRKRKPYRKELGGWPSARLTGRNLLPLSSSRSLQRALARGKTFPPVHAVHPIAFLLATRLEQPNSHEKFVPGAVSVQF